MKVELWMNGNKSDESEEGEAGNTKTHVVTSESVESEAKAFLDCLQTNKDAPGGAAHFMVPDLAAAWMLRDGNDLAQPPEPPLFEPSPPKLQDLTGKDILGVELSRHQAIWATTAAVRRIRNYWIGWPSKFARGSGAGNRSTD